MSYYRSTSPGGRRIYNPARASDSFADPYYSSRSGYTSPRTSSERVIPISTQTFLTPRPVDYYDTIPGSSKSRRSTVNDTSRPSVTSSSSQTTSSRSRPTVVQGGSGRPVSPLPRVKDDRDPGYHSSSSAAPRREHKKVYSIDESKNTRLVADIDLKSPKHRRRESLDRSGRRESLDRGTRRESVDRHARRESVDRNGYATTERNGRTKEYHLAGPLVRTNNGADDYDGFSYTTPAGMYSDTEPRWRPARRGSVGSRERPKSMMVDSLPPVKAPAREQGPPPTTRALDRVNEGYGVTRANSARQPPIRSPNRPIFEDGPANASDDEYRDPRPVTRTSLNVPSAEYSSRPSSNRHSVAIVQQERPEDRFDQYATTRNGYDDRRDYAPKERYEDRRDVTKDKLDDRRDVRDTYEQWRAPPLREERRDPPPPARDYYDERPIPRETERAQLPRHADRSVERRGFGIRSNSIDRYGNRGSNESFDGRDPYAERPPKSVPEVLDPARTRDPRDLRDPRDVRDLRTEEPRRDIDRRDPAYIDDYDRNDYDRYADNVHRSHDSRKDKERVVRDERDDYAGQERDVPRPHREQEKDRYRDQDRERDLDRERERDRERDRDRRKDSDRGHGKDGDGGHGILPVAAIGGLGAAALYGANEVVSKRREKERESDPVTAESDRKEDKSRRNRESSYEVPREPRDAVRDLPPDPRDLPRESRREPPREIPRDHQQPYDPTPPAPLPSSRDAVREKVRDPRTEEDRYSAEETERRHVAPEPPVRSKDREAAEVKEPAIDPDEEYRRRLEQARESYKPKATTSEPTKLRGFLPPEMEGDYGRRERNERRSDRDTGAYDDSPPPSARERPRQDPYSENPNSILDRGLSGEPAEIIDNRNSTQRENRVRIVEPPSEKEPAVRGILKQPKVKFPEDPNPVREGVAPLKDAKNNGIPPGARWTKIDRRLVNPEALEGKERYEERLDCVIVLRVLTKEEIQKYADKTQEIRDGRYDEEKRERRERRRKDKERARREADEYVDDDSEDEFRDRSQQPRMLEAPAGAAVNGPGGSAGATAVDADAATIVSNGSAAATASGVALPAGIGGGNPIGSGANADFIGGRDRERERERERERVPSRRDKVGFAE